MSRTNTPRDMPAQDPIDRLEGSSARLRQVASDLYSADVNEITAKTEVHVHMPSHPDARISDLPSVPMQSKKAGVLAGVAGLVSAAVAIAKALGWL